MNEDPKSFGMAAKDTADAGMAKVEAKEPASKKNRRRRGIDKRILSQMFMMPLFLLFRVVRSSIDGSRILI